MTTLKWTGLAFAMCVAACSAATSAVTPGGGGGQKPGSSSGGGSDAGGGGNTTEDGGTNPTESDGAVIEPGTDGGPTTGTDSGGGSVAATKVQILVEPNGNKASEIVAAINGAKKSVHLTMYLMDDPNIITALINQSKAGLDVKIILNDFSKSTTSGSNTTVYNQLKGAGVNVIYSDPNQFTLTHEKCLMIDATTAWIMTMNFEKSSSQYNREYLAIDTEAADVAEAEAIFAADFAGTTGYKATGSLVIAPEPPNNSRSALVALINSAKSTLDLELEEFSDTNSKGISAAITAAAQRGVKTRVILANSTPTANQTGCVTQVKSAGAKVVVSGGTTGSSSASNPYVHAKAIVIDCSGTTCASGWVGSENMTGGSLGYNRELGVVIANGTELAKIETTMNTDFAAGTPQ